MEILDVTKKARELGKAIQEDVRYIAYCAAKKANDEDKDLQDKIGQFNLIRMNLDNELSSKTRDDEKVKHLNGELKDVYSEIMHNETMQKFTMAKQGMDMMMNEVNSIIAMCADGEDPDTCEVTNCTGSCSTCSGCH